MANSSHLDYSGRICKHIPDPKGLRRMIHRLGKIKTREGLNSIEYVDYFQMFGDRPLRRIYAFAYSKPEKYLYIKEVARYYGHKQYLSVHLYWYSMIGKRVDFLSPGNNFLPWPDENNSPSRYWDFWPTQSLQKKEDFLRENNLPYTGWNIDIDNITFEEYLNAYFENPKIELLAKSGLGYWVRYLKYLDTSKKTLHEIFKINQDAVPLLMQKDFRFYELMACRKLGSTDLNLIHAYLEVKRMKKQYTVDDQMIEILDAEITVKYISKLIKLKGFRPFDYLDYLRDLKKLGALSDPKAIYPKAFKKAHKEASAKIKLAESEKLMAGFRKAYKKHQKYLFENNGLLIRPVREPSELYKESDVLGHCVRGYDKNVAAGTTEIMFIRKKNAEDKPYFTLELKNRKVIQVRGKDNKDPDKAVEKFVSTWAENFRIKYTGEQAHYYY